MEDLDERWIKLGSGQQCEHDEKTPATLGLKNMAGVFILVAAGIVCGVGLIFIEIMYKRHQIRRQRRMELARHVTDKWRTMVEVIQLKRVIFKRLSNWTIFRNAKIFGRHLKINDRDWNRTGKWMIQWLRLGELLVTRWPARISERLITQKKIWPRWCRATWWKCSQRSIIHQMVSRAYFQLTAGANWLEERVLTWLTLCNNNLQWCVVDLVYTSIFPFDMIHWALLFTKYIIDMSYTRCHWCVYDMIYSDSRYSQQNEIQKKKGLGFIENLN